MQPTESPAIALGWSDRLLPGLLLGSIGVGLGLGATAPGFARSLSNGVSVGVFGLIFLVFLNVGIGSLKKVFSEPRFVAAAVGLNFIVNPLLAWALGLVFLRGSPELRVGLVLFLVTPCIGWYLVFTEMAGGDAALGVSLLGINVVLQVVLLPVYLALFVGDATAIPMSTVARSIVLYLVAPATLAAMVHGWCRCRRTSVADLQRLFRVSMLKGLALAIVIVSMFASQTDVIFDNRSVVGQLLAPIAAFFVLAFAAAIGIGRRMGLPDEQQSLLAFTATSRNSEASLAIAATAFASPLVGLTVVMGPVIELPLLVIMVRVLQRLRTDDKRLANAPVNLRGGETRPLCASPSERTQGQRNEHLVLEVVRDPPDAGLEDHCVSRGIGGVEAFDGSDDHPGIG